ncbi:MAG: carboxypeptidase-like regulatory domain-containing protein [Cyanobacteria bacterium P01_E01_bin.45]
MRTYSIVQSILVPLVVAIAVGIAGHPGLAQESSPTPAPEAPEGDTATVQIESNSLGKVVGQITNQAGQPIANARVIVRGARRGDVRTGLFRQTAQTDTSGTFELDGGLPGRWLLSVRHPDYEDLNEEVWLFGGLTTPVAVQLSIPIRPQPRTRLGVIGVGTLAHTEFLSQRMASEAVRLGLVPESSNVLPLDNRNLQPVLEEIGSPLFDILEHDEIEPEEVNQFFDFLGLEALVVAKVDVLSQATETNTLSLRSRSRLELWTIDDRGEVQVQEIARSKYDAEENATLNAAELEQIYQIQVTRMATEIGEEWTEDGDAPLARFEVEADTEVEVQPRTTLDTTVELAIPRGANLVEDAPAFPEPVEEDVDSGADGEADEGEAGLDGTDNAGGEELDAEGTAPEDVGADAE